MGTAEGLASLLNSAFRRFPTLEEAASLTRCRLFCCVRHVVPSTTLAAGRLGAVTCDEALRSRRGPSAGSAAQPAATTVASVTAAGRAWTKRMRRLAVAAP